MTRGKAIRTVVRYLDTADGLDDNLHQAKYILENMLSAYAGKKWDDRTICLAVEKFIDEHGRPPTVKELDRSPALPCHRSIELEFGLTASKWLMKYYPGKEQLWYKFRDEGHSPAEYRAVFIREYNRIQPHSSLEYNRRRNPHYPSWQYTACMLNLRLWSELIDSCRDELDIRPTGERTFEVESHILDIQL